MRVIFMGTPDFAVPALAALLEAGHEVAAVYTQPPRPGGRRGKEPRRRSKPLDAARPREAPRPPRPAPKGLDISPTATLDVTAHVGLAPNPTFGARLGLGLASKRLSVHAEGSAEATAAAGGARDEVVGQVFAGAIRQLAVETEFTLERARIVAGQAGHGFSGSRKAPTARENSAQPSRRSRSAPVPAGVSV